MQHADTDTLLKEILERIDRVCDRRNLGPANKEALKASITALFNKKINTK
jgi:hypothetical protein